MQDSIKTNENNISSSRSHKDLTEESSHRNDNGATEEARNMESDDINEDQNLGKVSKPDGDNWAENKVSTSLDDE